MQMLNKIEEAYQRMKKTCKIQYYVICDAILAAIVLRPEMVRNSSSRYVDVELNGSKTRGQVVIDHLQEQKANVNLIDDFDSEMLKELLYFVVNPNEKDNAVLFSQIFTPSKNESPDDSQFDELQIDLL